MARKSSKSKKKKRPARKKKTAKKTVKRKKVVRRKAAPKKPKAKKAGAAAKGPKLPTEPIGRVTHYFPKVRAAAIRVERDGVRLGDTLYFKGHTTRFKQNVHSMQIDRQPVQQAGPDEEIGIRVNSRVREHDLVFKL